MPHFIWLNFTGITPFECSWGLVKFPSLGGRGSNLEPQLSWMLGSACGISVYVLVLKYYEEDVISVTVNGFCMDGPLPYWTRVPICRLK